LYDRAVTESHNLRIGELSRRTGVSPELLRAWERRYGLLQPSRSAGGYRLYSAADEARIRRMQARLSEGLSAAEAAQLAATAVDPTAPDGSLFAAVRRGTGRLEPQVLSKRALVALSHALEDECSAQAERGLVVGAFQERRHYAASADRWRDLARGARRAVVFADFPEARSAVDGPAEVPLPPDAPLEREWAVLYLAPRSAVLLVGRELPGQARGPDGERRFEVVWSAEPDAVVAALECAAELAAETAPDVAEALRADLERLARPAGLDPAFVTALTNRMIGYLTR
jgi:DICT domain-containing protein